MKIRKLCLSLWKVTETMKQKFSIVSILLWFSLFAAGVSCTGVDKTSRYLVNNLIPMPRSVVLTGGGMVSPSEISIDTDAPDDWNDEQYSITITPERIAIQTRSERGVVWARRTLGQLRDSRGNYPQVRIEDWPEFPMRGLLWDDGRNFVGTDMIRHYLDLMSAYKLNLFQWHLTDHPAWRIECRCYPQLNDARYQRPGRDTGCFYTYDEIREIIEYAADLGIMVVPEIDMPGHSTYFPATFGCTMDSERGRKILEDCIAEFCEEIPADLCPYIHIGSDEVRIPDPDGFMRWSQDLLRSHGRETLVWDPGLPADSLSIRQIWRDGSPDDSEIYTDTKFVDSSMGYLNYYDALLFPAKIFFHTPCYTGCSSEVALGGIICMWNDVRAEDKSRIEHHNGLASGIVTFAERFWNGGRTVESYAGTILPADGSPEMERFEEFQRRVANHKKRFLKKELAYWSPIHAPQWSVEIKSDEQTWSFEANGDILDLDAFCRAHEIPNDKRLECRISRTIYSDCDTVRWFVAGFDSPARSNRISDGIPVQGEWPNHGYVSVNGERIAPPQWKEPGSYSFHFHTWARPEEEFPYTDEQLYWMNEPSAIPLHKGENTVELGLQRHFRGQRFHVAFVEREK